jgi:hypothetical protein
MICVGFIVAFLLWVAFDWLFDFGWIVSTSDEPAWLRRLAKWWERHVESSDKPARRAQGFDVRPPRREGPPDQKA